MGPPDSRRDVVAIDRVFLVAGGKQRVICFVEGDDLEIVTEPEAQSRRRAHLPLVLGEHLQRVIVDELIEFPKPDGEPFGVGPWVGRVERRIRVELEGAVLIDLRDSPELGVVVPRAELHVVVPLFAWEEPRVIILDLIIRIPRALRFRAGLSEEAEIVQLRRTFGLLVGDLEAGEFRTLRAPALVAVPPVLPRPRHADRVDASVAEHARQGADRRLIQVGLVLRRLQRDTVRDDGELRRDLAQPADRPRIVRADLVVETDQRVPVRAIFGNREIEVVPRRKDACPVGIVHLPLETEKEVGLVFDDRAADHTAPFAFLGGRFLQVALFDQKIRGRQFVAGGVPEQHTTELVGPGLGDGVDDGAARAAELRVIRAGDDLKLLDRLERGADLRARAGAEGVVRVVTAVDRDVVILTRLPGGDDRVVAHLVGRGELNAGEKGDCRKVIAVHRGKLAQLLGPDIAAHFGARRVNQRRLGRDPDVFLDSPDLKRQVDRQGVSHLQDQAAPLGRPEARQLCGNPVAPRHELRDEVAPVRAGHDLAKHAGGFVGHDDRDAGHDRTLFIDHLSADFRCSLLCKRRRRRQEKCRENRTDRNFSHLTPPGRW